MTGRKTMFFGGISALVALLPFFPVSPFLAVPLFITWCIFVAFELGGMLAFAGGMMLLTLWYLVFSLTAWSIALAVALVSVATVISSMRSVLMSRARVDARVDPYCAFLFVGILFGDGLLLRTFLIDRTSDALASPWNSLPPAIFFLFFATSLLILLLSRENSRALFKVAISLHLFTAFAISSIVYGIGFGFDAFLHRAAEEALLQTGSILPKTPLYAGQYVLVATLAHLTHLSVRIIDIWLVPTLSAIILPQVFGKKAVWLLLFPFSALTFTVPYNLTVVYALWLIAGWDDRGGRGEPRPYGEVGVLVLSMLAVFTHPLLGLPMAVVTGYVIVRAQKSGVNNPALAICTTVATGLSVPAIMFVYNHLQGVSLAATNPFTRLEYFTGLFADPFPPAFGPSGGWWDLFYIWNLTGPLVIALVALAATLRKPSPSRSPSAVLTLGIFIICFLLSTLFVFKDVIVFEQFEYALRLIHVLPLLLSPLAGGLFFLLLKRLERFPVLTTGLLVFPALAMTASLYFSYPQENPKVQIAGPSVSANDVLAVHRIDEDAKGEPYIVLSNQMTSAAAIQEFGFRDYVSSDAGEVLWYAIPTGGPLYKFYSDMTYYQPRRDIAESAAKFAQVKTVYYLTYRYWPGYEYISTLAGQDADEIFRVNKGDILLFKYSLKD